MPNVAEFAKRLKKAREKIAARKNNPKVSGLRNTETIPPAGRGFGLIKKKKKRKPILRPEVI
jgi:hypothetical protein